MLKLNSVLFYSEITNPPVSVSAYFDTWASFDCEGEGEVLLWQTNGKLLTDEIKETRNITIHSGITTTGIVKSTLVILAKPEPWHDGLNIGCVVGNHGSFDFDSAGANLFVKGNDIMIYSCFCRIKITVFQYTGITPVEDLTVNIGINEYARVVWNPPSFVANDVKSLRYRVVIKDGNGNELVNIETPESEYEVSIDISSLCSIYTVNVTAYDEKYTSNSSIIQQEYIGGNYVYKINNNTNLIDISYQ